MLVMRWLNKLNIWSGGSLLLSKKDYANCLMNTILLLVRYITFFFLQVCSADVLFRVNFVGFR